MEGALLEAERNVHAIARGLPRLLAPAMPLRGKRPGWLMLVSNGGGGYWYEVTRDYPEALETSLHAVRDLREALPGDDALQTRLTPLSNSLEDKLEALWADAPWVRRRR